MGKGVGCLPGMLGHGAGSKQGPVTGDGRGSAEVLGAVPVKELSCLSNGLRQPYILSASQWNSSSDLKISSK